MSTPEPSTAERLEAAALRLLERDGVLAGLNLREVAAEAGVARGLVYHHFGSRRALLRSALERGARERRTTNRRRERLPARERLADFFRSLGRDDTHVRLLTLLTLDGDEGFTALPHALAAREANERDVAAGLLADDLAIDALHAGQMAALYGWVIYRRSFAASLGRNPGDLDADVLEMISRMWEPVTG